LPSFEVPLWVMIGSAACLALGNLIGGMRIMGSVGTKFFRIRPIHGFSAELSSTAIILISSLLGGNVSTTHVTSMSIIGAGAAERISMVRWGFVRKVLMTWVFTIRSEEHTSELQSRENLVCRLLLEKKNIKSR